MNDEHQTVQRLIEAHFAADLDAAGSASLREHLRDCDACRSHYDRRALELESIVGTTAANRLADDAILHTVLGAPEVRSVPSAQRHWWPAFVLAPAAAMAAALIFSVSIDGQDRGAGYQARGGMASEQELGIGIAGLDPTTGASYDARRVEGVLLEHRLRFSYTNTRGRARFLFLFGVDDDLHPFWYFPLPEEEKSIPISQGPGVQQSVLPYETELGQRHHAGRLHVVALFSLEPVKLATVKTALLRARAEGRGVAEISWPGDPEIQIETLTLVAEERP